MKRWYALRTKVQQEVWAENNLIERGLEVYLPRYLKRRRHARKTDYIQAPLFPRYLFARADVDLGERPTMAYAPGIDYVVSFGDRLATVGNNIIDEIRAREDQSGMIAIGIETGFKPGQKVRVSEGALCDHVGMFQCTSDDQRVFVLLDMLGRQVRVRLSQDAIIADG